MGHGVEHSKDLTDGVAARRDRYLITIGVRDHIVEHEGIWPKEDVDDSDVGVPIFFRVDPFECAVGGRTLDEHGVLHGLTFSLLMIRMTCIDNSVNKCPQERTITGLLVKESGYKIRFQRAALRKQVG